MALQLSSAEHNPLYFPTTKGDTPQRQVPHIPEETRERRKGVRSQQNILGWIMDGATMYIELFKKKRETILKEMKDVLRSKQGVLLKKKMRSS